MKLLKFQILIRVKTLCCPDFYRFFHCILGVFEQSGGSLSLFAEKNLDFNLLGFHMDPNVVNNTSNALFVILFSPLIGLLWIWLSKKKT